MVPEVAWVMWALQMLVWKNNTGTGEDTPESEGFQALINRVRSH
jgi:hypothetical protein